MKRTIRQNFNRLKTWFFHTFIYRGNYYCKDSRFSGFSFSRLCPHCKLEFESWMQRNNIAATKPSQCECRACIDEFDLKNEHGMPLYASRFIVCPECGNKRCPKATDHRHACTGSNEPGQPGSVYQ